MIDPQINSNIASSIVFIDSRVPDLQAVIAAAQPDTKVVVLNAQEDGVSQIAKALQGEHGLASISVVSHGDQGVLLLGNGPLHTGNIDQYQADLKAIGDALAPSGDLLLYGCDVGAGEVGAQFIQALSQLTGADVAASLDGTGAGTRGGNWDLEISTGQIEAVPALDAQALAGYGYLLHTASVSNVTQLKAAIAAGIGDNQDDIITLIGNITFASAGDAITINVTDGHTMTIEGGNNTLSGNNLARVLNVSTTNANSAVAINNLTISNGLLSGTGGGAPAPGAVAGGDALGAGISNTGTLTLTNVALSGNKAAGGGGGAAGPGGQSGGGGGGGGFGTTSGAAGGSNENYLGTAPAAGKGGDGAGTPSTPTIGGGGGQSGGIGNVGGAAGSLSGGSTGGMGGSANAGSGISIGGGGGGGGNYANGARGGNAAAAIYNNGGTLKLIGSTFVNNIAAGGGGGGGSHYANFPGNGGAGGDGIAGIWNKSGTVLADSATQTSIAGATNVGGGGGGGSAQGGGGAPGAAGASVQTKGTIGTLVNVAPVTTTSGGTSAFTEGANVTSTPVAVDNGITVTDSDNSTLASATVSITGNLHTAEDVLAFTNNPATMGNITGSYTAGTGVLALSSAGATATLAQWQAALRSVTYTNSSDSPNTSNRTVSFAVNDGTASSTAATKTVSVASVNDTPVNTASGGNTAFVAGNNGAATPVTVDSGFTVTDADNSTLASAMVAITGNLHTAEDVLAFTNNPATMGNITASYTAGTGVLALTSAGSTATLAQWQAALRSVTYTDSAVTPNTANRTISFTTNDGTADGNTVTKIVTVAATNQTPIATTSGGTSAFTEGANVTSTPVAVDNGITVTDSDNSTLASATVSITGNLQVAEDVLAFTNNPATMGNISGSYAAGTGILTLTSAGATATLPQWQAALRSVTYTNSSDSPNTANRTISFVVNDGSSNSTAGTKTLSVAAVNDAPVNTTSGGDTTFSAGNSGINTPVVVDGSFTVTDADNSTLASATVSITGNLHTAEDVLAFTNNPATMGNITGSYTAGTGVLALSSAGATATLAQWQAALRSVTYNDTSTAPNSSSRTISFTTNDGTTDSNAATKQVAMNVDLVNPTITAVTSTKANGNYSEGTTISVQVTFSETVTVTGTPQLTLETGATDRIASYASGSGSNTLSFTYSVQAGDTSADLDFKSTTALALNGGTIKDAAGNNATLTLMAPGAPGSLGANKAIVIDTQAPNLASSTPQDDATGVSASNNLTLTFSENVTAAEGLVTLYKASDNSVVEQFDLVSGEGNVGGTASISGTTVTIDPRNDLAFSTDYYLLAQYGAVKDSAGNFFNGITSAEGLNFTTGSAPSSGGGGTTTPPANTVDGTPVTTTTGANGVTTITVPVVTSTRADTAGSASPLADIPLAKDASGQSLLQVGVPTGVGFTAEGLPSTVSGSAAQSELTQRIDKLAGTGSELGPQAQDFLATLGSSTPLTVQTITPTTGAGFNPGTPLVITGGAGSQAVVVDARNLPSSTIIQVDNVEFIAIVGAVRVIGGAGQNAATGDGAAQWIVLGPDDDIIHGGAGNDVVGSEAGDDQVYGDAGDDIVFGGAGNDLLSGGTGSDRLNGGTGFDVALQEGARADYTITLDGAGIKLTHTASGVSDWLVDVEQVRFASGPSLTVAHSAAEEAAAFLFQKWLGRDLTQSEGAIIQSLTGQSAEQVATLFAQFFPSQAAGKTTAQLLDGMSAAGAIRVDAVRDVIVSGDAGNNTITPTLGLAKMVDGGAGIDTVVLPATLAQTFVQHNASGTYTLQRLTDGAMLDVTNVERVNFSDTKLALDLNGHAGEAARLLGALAGPGILSNKAVVGEVIRMLDAGATSQTIAGLGLQLVGASTSTQIAQTLWTNVVGRAGTSSELKILTDIMAGGVSAAELVVMAAHLDATATRIDLVGLAAKGIEFA